MELVNARIWPFVIAGLVLLLVYRRLRRNFGRQPLRPVRMWIRVGLLTLVGCALLPAVLKSAPFMAAMVVGIAAGTALGLWGARRTRYATDAGRLYYVPHTTTGVAVSLLLTGRMAYRFAQIYTINRGAGGGMFASDGYSTSLLTSPLTVGLLFTVVSYYICYNTLVLWRAQRISPEDLETVPVPTVASIE